MRCIVIDDERLARKELIRLLAAQPEIELVGEAATVDEAVSRIDQNEPDLIFLDIQMPGGTGFDVLEKSESTPLVIFTTAYDEFAVRAFEVNALDYLMKPISAERLSAAIEKAQTAWKPPVSRKLSRVFVREGERCWLIPVTDISLLESEGNYTRLYFGADRPLILRSLQSLEERLNPELFFRASRQHIVNLSHVTNIEKDVNGSYVAKLKNGRTVELSRRQSARLRELLSL
jgi:two-component system, LytTR family, response regulator